MIALWLAGMTVGGWMLSSEFAVLFGMLIGLAGLGVQWYYKHKLTMAEIRLKEDQAARDKDPHAAMQRLGLQMVIEPMEQFA